MYENVLYVENMHVRTHALPMQSDDKIASEQYSVSRIKALSTTSAKVLQASKTYKQQQDSSNTKQTPVQ